MTRIELTLGRDYEFGKMISLNIDMISSVSELTWDENERKDDHRVHCRVCTPNDAMWYVTETYDEVIKKMEKADEAEEKEGEKS